MFRKVIFRVGFLATLLFFISACSTTNEQGTGSSADVLLAVFGLIIFVALVLFWQARQTPANRDRYHLDDHDEHAAHEHDGGVAEHVAVVAETEAVKSPLVEIEDQVAAQEVEVAAVAAAPLVVEEVATRAQAPDDLTRIEGIGPKINDLLNAAGIFRYEDLANTPIDRLQKIMQNAGPQFRLADVSTWPVQAQLAAKGDWEGLKSISEKLQGGRIT